MRSLYLLTATIMAFSSNLFAQHDFATLDKLTYDYYLKGDYKNLKQTGDSMLAQGIDYYFLRMRMGISAFNRPRYPIAVKHFNKALQFSSIDTVSREYIYNSYLLSGLKGDANIYLKTLSREQKNNTLKAMGEGNSTEFYIGSSYAHYEQFLYQSNSLNYESIENSLNINAGFESYFSSHLKGTFAYTNYQKSGIQYSNQNPEGTAFDFSQNQLYTKFTALAFPGWEFSGFGHFAFYTEKIPPTYGGMRGPTTQLESEYNVGLGIAKNVWKIRTGANGSISNFGGSSQYRGEGYLTYLPFGNLNLYFSSIGMGQTDKNWGSTYQFNQEIGFKVFKFMWLESGVLTGNSFLYARNKGFDLNNSYHIPSKSVYGNLIFLLGKKLSITLTSFYNENENYSWDLINYQKYDKQILHSFGGAIKLTYKNK